MLKNEAEALAFKREQHKSKYITDRGWQAVHNSVKGWHVALVPFFTAGKGFREPTTQAEIRP